MTTDSLIVRAGRALPRHECSLNGLWEIQPGGEKLPEVEWTRRVPVPGLVDLAAPPYDWRQHRYHWYRRAFRIDCSLQPATALLTLEQAMFGTEVWLNGCRLGDDIACYTSQEYNLGNILRSDADNVVLVRVGARETLPSESAVGNDQERTDFIPGLWGDVRLTLCGNPRIKRVHVIPHLATKLAEVRVTIENNSERASSVALRCMIHEHRSGLAASAARETARLVPPRTQATLILSLPMDNPRWWSPDDPFLYQAESMVSVDEAPSDVVATVFGMREFRVSGPDFLLNGKKIFLRGGNIAFHRFLSDADRRELPWDLAWVKKLLIDIPKAHNFNFFRNHLGQMYNRWYDIADEYGMLLQNEWMFWTTSGTPEQITSEFSRWLQDNWNHPSIIIWDALNECSDPVVQKEIVPAMKKLDPTRPWESVDFVEQHPYIYSLGPVLVDRRFGFTDSLEAIEKCTTPSMVNEFLWWWLDKDFHPTLLTNDVVERWLGPDWTKEELIERQSFLASELVELFRRMDVKAIQPFVYLSNNTGPTGHWFAGNIADLHPKPILATLRNAFAPFGVSIELWDRHFFTGERRTARLFIFNDGPAARRGTLRFGIRGEGGRWLTRRDETVDVPAASRTVRSVGLDVPSIQGTYWVTAELIAGEDEPAAGSRKIAHVVKPPQAPASLQETGIAFLGSPGEITNYLASAGIATETVLGDRCGALLIAEGVVREPAFQSRIDEIDRWIQSGKTLIVLEPEFGVVRKELVQLTNTIRLTTEPRNDIDKGGYDSYLFAATPGHPLWKNISKEHLKMFNGGYGGEIVSEHHVAANVPATIHARCGLRLRIPAVFEMPAGRGRIIVSRLQVRGRLARSDSADALYARRPDPVLQQYFLNLLAYALRDD